MVGVLNRWEEHEFMLLISDGYGDHFDYRCGIAGAPWYDGGTICMEFGIFINEAEEAKRAHHKDYQRPSKTVYTFYMPIDQVMALMMGICLKLRDGFELFLVEAK